MAPADQTYFDGDVVEMVGLHRPNADLWGICRCRHEGSMCEEGEGEMFCAPCLLGSGYKCVEDPLWPPDGLKGPDDHMTARPGHGGGWGDPRFER